MLSTAELFTLIKELRIILDTKLEEILIKLNRNGKLIVLLQLLDLSELVGEVMDDQRPKDGKIIVIGDSETKKEILLGVAKSLGFQKDRFEFHLEYEDGKTFDFRKTQYSPLYTCILVGPMPHSGRSKAEYSSVITALEQEAGYPPVFRLGLDELKITKSSFRRSLEKLMQDGVLVA